jgi:hypothetical protein
VENNFSQGCYLQAAVPEIVILPTRMPLRGGDGLSKPIGKPKNKNQKVLKSFTNFSI